MTRNTANTANLCIIPARGGSKRIPRKNIRDFFGKPIISYSIQAALGNSQLQRADEGLKRQREIAAKYNTAFSGKNFIHGQSGDIDGHAYHLYIVEVNDRKGLYDYLREHKIFAQVHYIPVHLQPYYRQFGWTKGDLPNAENYYQKCISLPMYPALTSDEQKFVIDKISEFNE